MPKILKITSPNKLKTYYFYSNLRDLTLNNKLIIKN